MNYFKLFEVNQNYSIDRENLAQQYLKLQKIYHPDRAQNAFERRINLETSIAVNQGFKILQDDYLRAVHLLELEKQIVDETFLKAALSEDDLELILEEHELLTKTNGLMALQQLNQIKIAQQGKLIRDLDNCLSKNNHSQSLQLIARLKYLNNLLEKIQLKITKLPASLPS